MLLSGLALFTAGVAWLSRIPVHGSYLANLLGPDLIIGVGLGLAFISITIASTAGVPDDRAGLAGGPINTTQQIGGAIGLAIITTVAAGHASVIQSAAAAYGGFRAGLLVAAGIGAAATVAALWFPRRRASAAAVSVAEAGITSPAPAAA